MTLFVPPDHALLARYLADECSAPERVQVEVWAASHESHREELEALRAVYVNSARPAQAFHRDRAWSRVDARTSGSVAPASAAARRSRMLGPVVGMLAATVLLLGAVWHERHLQHSAASSGQHYTTLPGQRVTIALIDGTQLSLAPASMLDVPADYATGNRTVRLEGEGYFAVVHNNRHPFTVITHRIQINDVGTEFDVRAYDENVRVAVAKGEISLRSGSPLPLTLSPVAFGAGRGDIINDAREGRKNAAPTNDIRHLTAGEMAEATDTGFTVTHRVDIAEIGAWRQGHLVFEDVTLQSAARDLERTFNLTITIADTALARRHITAAFDNESVAQILDDIAGIVGARYELTGRSVTFLARTTSFVPDHSAAHPESLRTAQAGEPHE